MKRHLKYVSYILRHKWFVLVAGLKIGVPIWQLLAHDMSKFMPSEWLPYLDKFYGGPCGIDHCSPNCRCLLCRSRKARFEKAWNQHIHHNPHHWDYWLLYKNNKVQPLPMPDKYIREMVADWAGAGRAIHGKWDLGTWFNKNKDTMILAEATQLPVAQLVATLHAILD